MVLKIPPPPPIANRDPTLNRWLLELTSILNGSTSDLGVVTAPTAPLGTNTDQIATTAFVIANAGTPGTALPLMDGVAAVGVSTRFARQDHVHPTDTSRAPTVSPALTGTPTAPTAAPLTNDTQLATTAYVDAAVAVVAAEITSGVWTPTLIGSTGGGPVTYVSQNGSYERVGRLIVVRFNLLISALNGITGDAQIGGLPFTAANTAGDSGQGVVNASSVTNSAGFTSTFGDIQPNTAVVRLLEQGSGQSVQLLAVSKLGATTAFDGMFAYHV